MKRSILILAALVACLAGRAETAFVMLNDGSVQQYDAETVTFSTDGTVVDIVTVDGLTVSCAVADVKQITFAQPTGAQPETFAIPETVAFDSADATSFTSQTEKVTSDADDDEYGDFIENFSPKGTITIIYNGSSVTKSGSVSGVNVSIKGADVTITSSKKAEIVLKGTSSDGSLKLYATKKCQLTFDNFSLKNADGPAIALPKLVSGANEYGGKTVLVKLVGKSSLEDGNYTPDSSSKGTFFSEGQLIFSGTGSLNVISHSGHGIASDDYVRLRGNSSDGKSKHAPVITVKSAKDGISTKDGFFMYGGSLTVDAGDDGIDVSKANVQICGGSLTITAADEGVTTSYVYDPQDPAKAAPDIDILGGFIAVNTTGEKAHAFKSVGNLTLAGGTVQAAVKGAGSKCFNADGNIVMSSGKATLIADGLPQWDDEENDLSSSTGIRSRGTLTLSGATVAMMATADGGKGINSTGNITVSGGRVTILTHGKNYKQGETNSRARGITGDAALQVTGGRVVVASADDCLRSVSYSQSGGVLVKKKLK